MIPNPYNAHCTAHYNCKEWDDYTIQAGDTLYSLSVRYGVPLRILMACNKMINPYSLAVGQVIKVPQTPPTLPGCDGPNDEVYIIQLKDSLYLIAEKYDTTVEELMQRNPGLDPYNLKPGLRICVPRKTTTEPEMPSNPNPPENSGSNGSNGSNNSNGSSGSMGSNGSGNSNSSNGSGGSGGNSMGSNGSMGSCESTGSCGDMIPPMDDNDDYFCDGKTYTVREGDTLSKLLSAFNYTYATMIFANPNVDFDHLTEGTKICVPRQDSFRGCTSTTSYIVKYGDSLTDLSSKFGVTEDRMIKANPFYRPSDFSVPGTKICIPETE